MPVECRKTKNKVITPVNHENHKLPIKPIKIFKANTHNSLQAKENACDKETYGFGL